MSPAPKHPRIFGHKDSTRISGQKNASLAFRLEQQTLTLKEYLNTQSKRTLKIQSLEQATDC
jgi:hypothetical protein